MSDMHATRFNGGWRCYCDDCYWDGAAGTEQLAVMMAATHAQEELGHTAAAEHLIQRTFRYGDTT